MIAEKDDRHLEPDDERLGQDVICTDEARLTRDETDAGELRGSQMNVGAAMAGVMPIDRHPGPRGPDEGDPEPTPGCKG